MRGHTCRAPSVREIDSQTGAVASADLPACCPRCRRTGVQRKRRDQVSRESETSLLRLLVLVRF